MLATCLILLAPSLALSQASSQDEVVERLAANLSDAGFHVDLEELSVEIRSQSESLPDVESQQALFFRAGHWEAMHSLLGSFGITRGATPDETRAQVATAILMGLAAYYSPTRRTFVLLSDPVIDGGEVEPVVSHELFHAWRDQRDSLEEFLRSAKTLDEAKVRQSILEGEAEVLNLVWRSEDFDEAVGSVSADDIENTVQRILSGASALIYEEGARFILRRWQQEGRSAVDAAFQAPPPSTEQLLHPAKLGRDEPRAVDLPALPASVTGAELLREDVVGELSLYSLLLDLSVERKAAFLAAAGWDGDRLRAYRTEDGGELLVWRTLWDRAEDAVQFHAVANGPFRGSCELRGRFVDLVWGSSEELTQEVDRALREASAAPPDDADDAASTAAVEAEWLAAQRRGQPRVAGGWWVRPKAGLRIPVPEGWRQVELNGGFFLVAQPVDGFADNFVVYVEPNAQGVGLDELLAQIRRSYDAIPNAELVWIRKQRVAGRDAIVREQKWRVNGRDTAALVAVFHEDARLTVVEMTSVEKRWEERKELFQGLLPRIESSKEEAPADDG